MQWYYANNQLRQGPISETEFHRLVADGVIQASTLVWIPGMANWQPYETIAATLIPPLPSSDLTTGVTPVGSDETEVCVISGKRYPKREMAEYQGRWVSLEHREELFQRIRDDQPIPGQLRFAGFWLRFVAWLIDAVIIYIADQFLNFILIATHFQAAPPSNLNPFDPGAAMAIMRATFPSMIVNSLFGVLYFCFFVSRFSATPGKMALGLKIVRADGTKLGLGRVIGRYFAYFLDAMTLGIGYVIIGIDDQKRALHDYVCDTRVIKARGKNVQS